MAAYDDDSMSSPDPLADSMPSSLMRRMTRSQQSKQFMSLGGASVSPRRQTFSLEVGDNRSPQKLFVTVESEQQKQQAGAVRRRLFESPTPKKTPASQRKGRTTTTTIPLRDVDEEDALAATSATPRKRGRPRKYAPTPLPGTGKKRAGTPARKGTPGRPRKNPLPEEAPSEASAQPTPRASRAKRTTKEPVSDATVEATPASSRGKRGAKRKAVDEESSSVPASTPKKRGRPRKKPLVEEVQEVPEEHNPPQAPSPAPAGTSPTPLQSDHAGVPSPAEPVDNTMPASEGDIWMDTLSNEATPRPGPRSRSFNMSTTTADPPRQSPEAPAAPSEADDYAPMIETRDDTPPAPSRAASERPESEDEVMLITKPVSEAASDARSEASHAGTGRRGRDADTIAQSEEFSMIFTESMRSIHHDSSGVNASRGVPNEVGDTTNLFINKTLETIKEGMQSEQGDGSEHNRSDRSASHDGRQDEGEGQQEQQASYRYEPSHQDTEQEPELIDFAGDEGIGELADEYHAEEHASSHYEHPQQEADQEPEDIEDEEGEDFGHLSGGYDVQEYASSHHEPPLQDMEQEHEHVQDEDEDELAGEYHTREHASSHYGHSQQVTEQEPEHGHDEEDMAEEFLTQQPEWDADEPEIPASQYRQTPTERQPELSPAQRNSSPLWSGSPRRNKALPLSRQLLSIKAMQSQQSPAGGSSPQAGFSSPSRGSRRNSANPGEDSNLYEDSFSAIPEAVLEAATPRPQRTGIPSSNRSPVAQPEPQGKDAAASGVSGATDTIRSDASRMLTPEETPSPHSVEEAAEPKSGSPVVDSDRVSARSKSASPSRPSLVTQPEQSFLASRRPVQDEITPVGPPSSPQLPALQDANANRPAQLPEHERRPTLSPIVRAGLALQSVTSDHSSPMGPKTLGSPFKASANSTPRLGSAQSSRETEQAAAQPSAHQREIPSHEDPFAPSRRNNGQDSFLRALDESARQLQARRDSQPASVFDTTRATLNDADEMSWVAEGPVSAPAAQETVASRSSSMAANFGSVAARQDAVDGGEAGDAGSEDDEEEDIWVTEAQRPTPKQPRQQSFGAGLAQRAARRTLIPNTWRRNAQATPATKPGTDGKADSQVEEYSQLSQQTKESSSRQGSSAAKLGPRGGLDLDKFFSSPTVLPTLPGAGNTAPTGRVVPAPARTLPSNSMFPAVPQKDFQPSPARRSRLFSSAVSESAATSVAEQTSPLKPADPSVAEQASSSRSTGANMADQTSSSRSAGPSMATQQASPSKSIPTSMAGQQAAPSTPERSLPAVEQKQNFTPRRNHGNNSLFAPPSARSSAPTPPQMQLSRNDIARWQEETSMVLEPPSDSPEVERQPAVPLPHRTMSPSKSCLRSPLKPRTPGRVVEFAGAASPLQEAQARAANANARRVAPVQFVPPQAKQSPAKPSHPVVLEEDKENTPSDVSMSDTPQKSPLPEGLSQKHWGKDHWRLLDTLIQLRRRGPFPFDLEKAGYVRRERGLLGRVAAAGGQSMEIERWHVDVVDAFRAEVGGWDEGVLAKRVFALVVGEGRRGM